MHRVLKTKTCNSDFIEVLKLIYKASHLNIELHCAPALLRHYVHRPMAMPRNIRLLQRHTLNLRLNVVCLAQNAIIVREYTDCKECRECSKHKEHNEHRECKEYGECSVQTVKAENAASTMNTENAENIVAQREYRERNKHSECREHREHRECSTPRDHREYRESCDCERAVHARTALFVVHTRPQ